VGEKLISTFFYMPRLVANKKTTRKEAPVSKPKEEAVTKPVYNYDFLVQQKGHFSIGKEI
jgi:hypothetical protein